LELLSANKNARDSRVWRLGATYATLPFELQAGNQPHEFGLSIGRRMSFRGGSSTLDVALQQFFRSDGAGFSERATLILLGLAFRPL
jgi:hypothetical protein